MNENNNYPTKQITNVTYDCQLLKNGIVQVQSEHSFGDTFERLKSTALSRGITIFASINFNADAEHAGLKMNPT